MPVIKGRGAQKHQVRHITRLVRENNETLFAYAAMIEEPPEFVLNQLIATVLAKDKDFLEWRQRHPESHVPTRRVDGERIVHGNGASSRNGSVATASADGQ